MKFAHTIFVAFVLAKKLMSNTTISWSEINEWVKQNGNPDLIGVGYIGSSLSNAGHNSYAEVMHDYRAGKSIVTVNIVFAVQQGVATSKSWQGAKLDSHLKKRFGDNSRFRIQI